MSDEISIPFRLDHTNQIAVETDPNVQIQQHVMSLLNTAPGERVGFATYGVPLPSMLFEADDTTLTSELADDIQRAYTTWEQGLVLQGVEPVASAGEDGLVTLQVAYSRADAPSNVNGGSMTNVAIVSVGGTVTEVVRG